MATTLAPSQRYRLQGENLLRQEEQDESEMDPISESDFSQMHWAHAQNSAPTTTSAPETVPEPTTTTTPAPVTTTPAPEINTLVTRRRFKSTTAETTARTEMTTPSTTESTPSVAPEDANYDVSPWRPLVKVDPAAAPEGSPGLRLSFDGTSHGSALPVDLPLQLVPFLAEQGTPSPAPHLDNNVKLDRLLILDDNDDSASDQVVPESMTTTPVTEPTTPMTATTQRSTATTSRFSFLNWINEQIYNSAANRSSDSSRQHASRVITPEPELPSEIEHAPSRVEPVEAGPPGVEAGPSRVEPVEAGPSGVEAGPSGVEAGPSEPIEVGRADAETWPSTSPPTSVATRRPTSTTQRFFTLRPTVTSYSGVQPILRPKPAATNSTTTTRSGKTLPDEETTARIVGEPPSKEPALDDLFPAIRRPSSRPSSHKTTNETIENHFRVTLKPWRNQTNSPIYNFKLGHGQNIHDVLTRLLLADLGIVTVDPSATTQATTTTSDSADTTLLQVSSTTTTSTVVDQDPFKSPWPASLFRPAILSVKEGASNSSSSSSSSISSAVESVTWNISEGGQETTQAATPAVRPAECEVGAFRCLSGDQCVAAGARCNQERDCADGSDEVECSCADFLRAKFLTRKICDGVVDCWDYSDENLCGNYINSHQNP